MLCAHGRCSVHICWYHWWWWERFAQGMSPKEKGWTEDRAACTHACGKPSGLALPLPFFNIYYKALSCVSNNSAFPILPRSSSKCASTLLSCIDPFPLQYHYYCWNCQGALALCSNGHWAALTLGDQQKLFLDTAEHQCQALSPTDPHTLLPPAACTYQLPPRNPCQTPPGPSVCSGQWDVRELLP